MMLRYVVRRVAVALFVIWLVSLAVFAVRQAHISLLHPDYELHPASSYRSAFAISEVVERRDRMIRPDLSVPAHYVVWLVGDDWLPALQMEGVGATSRGVLRGDLGTSLQRDRPAVELLAVGWRYTAAVVLPAAVVAWLLALVLGVAAARVENRWRDRAVTLLALAAMAVPLGVLGAWLVDMLADPAHGFALPAGGIESRRVPRPGTLLYVLGAAPGSWLDRLLHLVLPTATLALPFIGSWTLFVRRWTRAGWPRSSGDSRVSDALDWLGAELRAAVRPTLALALFHLPAVLALEMWLAPVFDRDHVGLLGAAGVPAQPDWPVLQGVLLTVIGVWLASVLLAGLVGRSAGLAAPIWRRGAPYAVVVEQPVTASAAESRAVAAGWRLALGGVLLAVVVGLAALGALAIPHDPLRVPAEHVMASRNLPLLSTSPQGWHLLGTDAIGRDLASRLANGTLSTLAVALLVTVGAALGGTAVGRVARRVGGRVAGAMMALTDDLLALPPAFAALQLSVLLLGYGWLRTGPLEHGTVWVALLLVPLGWMGVARLVYDGRGWSALGATLAYIAAGAVLGEYLLSSWYGLGVWDPAGVSLGVLLEWRGLAALIIGVWFLLLVLSLLLIGRGLQPGVDADGPRG